MSHKLQEGAIVISDAHFSTKRPQLLGFLHKIANQEISTPQLILMGDIFDALFGSIEYTYQENEEVISLLKKIADRIEVVYLEGNHDFNLKTIFTNMKVYPISMQPVKCSWGEKTVWLAHGDYDAPFGYRLYTALIRNPIVLKLLKPLDNLFNHFILNFVYRHLQKKEDCKELAWFESFLYDRFAQRIDCDILIEGHFHQNKTFQIGKTYYINLGAFACNQRYFIVQSPQESMILKEKNYS